MLKRKSPYKGFRREKAIGVGVRGISGLKRKITPIRDFHGSVGKRKRRKRGEITKLKKKLWEIVRQVVFKRYGSDCYTCPQKNLRGANRHGGHVPWASSELSITCRYDPRYIRAQCYDCNVNKNGRGVVAFKKMVLEGIDTDEMWKLNQETKGVPRNKEWFEEKLKELSIL